MKQAGCQLGETIIVGRVCRNSLMISLLLLLSYNILYIGWQGYISSSVLWRPFVSKIGPLVMFMGWAAKNLVPFLVDLNLSPRAQMLFYYRAYFSVSRWLTQMSQILVSFWMAFRGRTKWIGLKNSSTLVALIPLVPCDILISVDLQTKRYYISFWWRLNSDRSCFWVLHSDSYMTLEV